MSIVIPPVPVEEWFAFAEITNPGPGQIGTRLSALTTARHNGSLHFWLGKAGLSLAFAPLPESGRGYPRGGL